MFLGAGSPVDPLFANTVSHKEEICGQLRGKSRGLIPSQMRKSLFFNILTNEVRHLNFWIKVLARRAAKGFQPGPRYSSPQTHKRRGVLGKRGSFTQPCMSGPFSSEPCAGKPTGLCKDLPTCLLTSSWHPAPG